MEMSVSSVKEVRRMQDKEIKFLVRSGGRYPNPEANVESALEAVRKIKEAHPNAEISVEVDIG